MINKLTILFAGPKTSLNAFCNFTIAEYINMKIGKKRFVPAKNPKDTFIIDTFNNELEVDIHKTNGDFSAISKAYSCKVYTFKDPVYNFCIDNLGLDYMQCYGTEEDKNSITHLLWDDFFDQIRENHSRPRRGSGSLKPASGYMTANEVVSVIENEVFKRLDMNCWARSLYSLIRNEGYNLSVINGASSRNEITIGSEIGTKAILLSKDDNPEELKEIPRGEFDVAIDVNNMSLTEQIGKVKKNIRAWFDERRII